MEKLNATDVKIVRGHNDRVMWVHACDDDSTLTHLPMSVPHCSCGASIHTSTAVRLPCVAGHLVDARFAA